MPQSIRTSPDTTPELLSSERPQGATPEHNEGPKDAVVNGLVLEHFNRISNQPRVELAVKQAVADRLREDPLASYTDISDELGVSKEFVAKVAAKIHSGDDLGDKRVKSYQRQIGKALPVSERVMIYADVARGVGDPKASFSKLGALKRLEELEGIVTRKEQREVADNSVPVLPPMFVLKDADVDIGVAIKIRSNKRQR